MYRICQLDGAHKFYLCPFNEKEPDMLHFVIKRRNRKTDKYDVWAECKKDISEVRRRCHNDFKHVDDFADLLKSLPVVQGYGRIPEFISWNLNFYDKMLGRKTTKVCILRPTWTILVLFFTKCNPEHPSAESYSPKKEKVERPLATRMDIEKSDNRFRDRSMSPSPVSSPVREVEKQEGGEQEESSSKSPEETKREGERTEEEQEEIERENDDEEEEGEQEEGHPRRRSSPPSKHNKDAIDTESEGEIEKHKFDHPKPKDSSPSYREEGEITRNHENRDLSFQRTCSDGDFHRKDRPYYSPLKKRRSLPRDQRSPLRDRQRERDSYHRDGKGYQFYPPSSSYHSDKYNHSPSYHYHRDSDSMRCTCNISNNTYSSSLRQEDKYMAERKRKRVEKQIDDLALEIKYLRRKLEYQ